MKEEILQLIPQKYKGLLKITMNNYMPRNCENLCDMDKFIEKYNLPKLNEEEAESLNGLIRAGEIEAVIKKLPAHKSPGPDGSQENFTKYLRKC